MSSSRIALWFLKLLVGLTQLSNLGWIVRYSAYLKTAYGLKSNILGGERLKLIWRKNATVKLILD